MVQDYRLLLVLGSVEQFSILVFTHHLGPTSVTVFLSSLASSQPRTDRESCRIGLICFYRAIHFSAKRGIATACRLSVRQSIRL